MAETDKQKKARLATRRIQLREQKRDAALKVSIKEVKDLVKESTSAALDSVRAVSVPATAEQLDAIAEKASHGAAAGAQAALEGYFDATAKQLHRRVQVFVLDDKGVRVANATHDLYENEKLTFTVDAKTIGSSVSACEQ